MTIPSQHAYGTTMLRLTLGTTLLAHGLLKITVYTIPGTVGFFEGLGLPPIAAYLTIFGETAGGMALLAGVYTRLVALLSIPLLMGATWAHLDNGWVFSNAGGGWEFPAMLVMLAATVAVQGSGAFAIRRLPIIDELVPQILRA
jgi:putative oxidoreductase